MRELALILATRWQMAGLRVRLGLRLLAALLAILTLAYIERS